ncbi:SpoIIE family protein phosphatase [Lutispora thermophila]|uniref:Stage II sporulation protein E (SpoIIE) n=1 Tax=Lutispora thermophila DSM 19022 TaxID=1122184 RepID=A0A1M6EGW7_9FIRM|nr:SpoIIE family protein phosphatase [Lutispora thermophila]SHI84673.1 Stage II sporulation protein E (SpoIIE) [Lutispora thermophila DSM 19022]
MNDLCTDVGYVSVNKFGEQLCGDHVEVVVQGDNSTVVVLADGLGSGVKASILSTLTAKIISTMMANGLSVRDCVTTIASTLPICKIRQVAYSTFTIIQIADNMEAEIIQYDNPHVILLRKGKNMDYPKTLEIIDNKTIYKSNIKLDEEDTFVAVSDGAIHAGVGTSLNFGWQREDIIKYLENIYEPSLTAKTLSSMLLNECYSLYGGKPGDDTTVCTVKIRQRKPVNLLIGPPADPKDVRKMMSLFFSKEGKHIVCGGTTSTLAAEFLKKPLEVGIPKYIDPDIPPTAKIEGVDLVTEGIITINRVLEYAKDYLKENRKYTDWIYKEDGASLIAKTLFEEATDINFYVGKAINPAYQNPDLPIGFNIKMRLVEELSLCLKEMGKRIKVSYF